MKWRPFWAPSWILEEIKQFNWYVCVSKLLNMHFIGFLGSQNIYLDIKCVLVIPSCKVMRKTGNGGHFGRHLGLRKTLKEDS